MGIKKVLKKVLFLLYNIGHKGIGEFMKQITEIEQEYEEFEIEDTFLAEMGEFQTYLDVRQDDLDDELKVLKKEKRTNRKYKALGELIDLLTCSFVQSNPEFFNEDNEIIDLGIKTVIAFKGYYSEMINIATEQNYRELARLAMFSTRYYNEHLEYIEYLRDKLERSFNGVSYYNPNYENNISPFAIFMRGQLDKNTDKKGNPMEKRKQM